MCLKSHFLTLFGVLHIVVFLELLLLSVCLYLRLLWITYCTFVLEKHITLVKDIGHDITAACTDMTTGLFINSCI